jgi:molybdopterin biosynthesis enzyme
MLLAAVASTGAQVLDLGIARDVEGQLEGALEKALAAGADVLVTSGEWRVTPSDWLYVYVLGHCGLGVASFN